MAMKKQRNELNCQIRKALYNLESSKITWEYWKWTNQANRYERKNKQNVPQKKNNKMKKKKKTA